MSDQIDFRALLLFEVVLKVSFRPTQLLALLITVKMNLSSFMVNIKMCLEFIPDSNVYYDIFLRTKF